MKENISTNFKLNDSTELLMVFIIEPCTVALLLVKTVGVVVTRSGDSILLTGTTSKPSNSSSTTGASTVTSTTWSAGSTSGISSFFSLAASISSLVPNSSSS
jgi:hypothetical protein